MDQLVNQTFEDLARGALYGAFCGDAIGAYVEFQNVVSVNQIEEALRFPGGGPFGLGRGQVTDDSELALCLGHGLVEGKGVLDLDLIAKYYLEWCRSSPFDVGITTRTAFSSIEKPNYAAGARMGAQQSKDSQSNGALMRIIPLCIWCSRLKKDELIKCVMEETKLTHPNQTTIDVSVAYAYTIQHLLNNKGDNEGAFVKAKQMIKELGNKEVEKWIEDVERNKLPVANEKIGWVRIAFCFALYFLKERANYTDAMRTMLSQAGDTDTNCCIVGGMLGALHGYKSLPESYTSAVKKFNPEEGKGKYRPSFLVVGECAETILMEIIANRPKSGEARIMGGDLDSMNQSKKKGFFPW